MAADLKILVTGSAGFIGHHLMLALRQISPLVVGLDSINSYYDVSLKYDRLKEQGFESSLIKYNRLIPSQAHSNLSFVQLDLADENALDNLFRTQQFDIVINLAAQAGVRFSLEHPQSYVSSNLVGFANLLECCRKYKIKHLLFASSSSVYGLDKNIPFSTENNTDYPISFYAATKKANEVMAHSYAHLYQIPTTGMRFFTVYGPWGRPDMAYFSFTKAILENSTIRIYNYGEMFRDFTYIDDVVKGIEKLITAYPQHPPKDAFSNAPYRIFNIGNSKPAPLLEMVNTLEDLLGKKAVLDLQPMQPGDVVSTYADVSALQEITGFSPATSLQEGLAQFTTWYRQYYA
ncbi:NAD-dependent epimerase/dehydratase family protein [Adhaeribacter soli]|uniref:NAD-dependent epimerase/dehydratase family protein n=1 Tax=Adhaeribacter soli TaxID=2607655 RepID=A0A5N1IV41_9BACT|nr:NAD-dependent epimerase/dehydratase family protein [Adhaeribacter soli]KAA9333801.1 NAD-dependent epimerase/dehydratase family protein [Adhaeribacter soli]